jgi:hypothetical protein
MRDLSIVHVNGSFLNWRFMEIISLDKPNVLIVKNFLDQEQIDIILNSLKNASEDEWYLEAEEKKNNKAFIHKDLREQSLKNWNGMTLQLTSRVDAKNDYPNLPHAMLIELENKIKKIVEKRFDQTLLLQLSGLHRWRPGREQAPHIDYYDSSEDHNFDMLEKYNLPKEMLEKFETTFNDKHFSSLVYLNDDYVGGELYMPQWDWEIRPEPGMLIAFEGNENHLHGVKMIEDGIRYTWSIFWTKFDWAVKNKLGAMQNV